MSASTVPAGPTLREDGLCVTLAGVEPLDPAAEAARRGDAAERFLVLVDGARATATDVLDLLARDAAAGVHTHRLDATSSLPDLALADAGALRAVAREEIIPEPLAASAPIARVLAPATCTGCAAYHGSVQDLRLLGVVGSPQLNGDFFRDALVASGAGRVIVAGAADYAMVAHVLAALPGACLTVIDRCPTPLLLSRWYAAMRGAAIVTAVADVTEHVADPPAEAIVTDSLLTLLDPPGRARTLACWRESLVPGGVAMTTLRLSPSGPPRAPSADAVDGFVGWVLEEARRRAGLLERDLDALERAARAYMDIPLRSWPVRDTDEIVALAEEAGLEIHALDVRRSPHRGPAGVSGPGANPDATYARVVLRRP